MYDYLVNDLAGGDVTTVYMYAILAFFAIWGFVVAPMINASTKRRARVSTKRDWLESAGPSWFDTSKSLYDFDPSLDPFWSASNGSSRVELVESIFLDKVKLSIDLTDTIPASWSFAVRDEHWQDHTLERQLRDTASAAFSAQHQHRNILSWAKLLFDGLDCARPSVSLENSKLELEFYAERHGELRVARRTSIDDIPELLSRWEGLVSTVRELAEISDASDPEALFERCQSDDRGAAGALRALLHHHPDHELTQRAIDDFVVQGNTLLSREVMLFGVSEVVWDAWQNRGGASSYMRARTRALTDYEMGPGALAHTRDLLERFDASDIASFFDDQLYGIEGTDDGRENTDHSFSNLRAMMHARHVFVGSAASILDATAWAELVNEAFGDGSFSYETNLDFEMSDAHAYEALSRSNMWTRVWLEQLRERPTDAIIEDAILRRLELELDDRYCGYRQIEWLVDELIRRTIVRSVGLLRKHASRFDELGYAITLLESHASQSQGGLSVLVDARQDGELSQAAGAQELSMVDEVVLGLDEAEHDERVDEVAEAT